MVDDGFTGHRRGDEPPRASEPPLTRSSPPRPHGLRASASSRARRVIPWRRRANPAAFALRIRRGARETTPARSVSTGARWSWAVSPPSPWRARLHLLNYGGRPVDALRIRVKGDLAGGRGPCAGPRPRRRFSTTSWRDGATEFSLPVLWTSTPWWTCGPRASGRSVPQVNGLEAPGPRRAGTAPPRWAGGASRRSACPRRQGRRRHCRGHRPRWGWRCGTATVNRPCTGRPRRGSMMCE